MGKQSSEQKEKPQKNKEELEVATFAGGCFWCVQARFEGICDINDQKLCGIKKVVSGFTGGNEVNPSYDDVAAGKTSHVEAVQIQFDPKQISYRELLDAYWREIDPTDKEGQFADRGKQYITAIFYHNEKQKELAEKTKRELSLTGRYKKPVITEIRKAMDFYPADDAHQAYYKKRPKEYEMYRHFSGRDEFLKNIWSDEKEKEYKKPADADLREMLTPAQYRITQKNDTEPPFNNEYWDNQEEGIYVDIVSGEPLFSSKDKFDSGTGWPSFTKPLEQKNCMMRKDPMLADGILEVRSKHADSHLGHIFNDGPAPTGKRFCMNSAALRFIPKKDLEKEGYKQYLNLFRGKKKIGL